MASVGHSMAREGMDMGTEHGILRPDVRAAKLNKIEGTYMRHLVRKGAGWALRHFLNAISWDGSGDKYVGQFRRNLERIALLVSEETDRWVEARYNNVTECAELFCPYDRVLAR